MRYLWLFVVLAFALQSCSRGDGARPEINKDKLVDVLVDIHITDGYLLYSGTRIDRDRDKIEGAYDYVLRKHNITPKQFRNTMKYYSRHTGDYERLYNKVIEKLTKLETENLKANEEDDEQSHTDKLQKARDRR